MAPRSAASVLRPWAAMLVMALSANLAVAGDSAADYYVRDLHGLPKDAPPIKMHAGNIEVTPEHNGNLFFWHFQNQHIANRQRTVIWINGGPGCSSEDGALMEIGPYRVKDPDTLVLNNGSWNEFANLLFVDNPVGTGFSYVDTDSYVDNLDTMAIQFTQFLEKFFALFPQYDQDDIYIAGESYAGQHIPYIAKAIIDRNKNLASKVPAVKPWNLKGLLIGNGWISPYEQYDAYLSFAFEKGLVKEDSDAGKQLKGMLRNCKKMISTNPGHVDYGECESILSTILQVTKSGSGNDACLNMYDVRLKDSYPSCGMNWPPDLTQMTPYLRKPLVVNQLHVDSNRASGWQECNGAVGSVFKSKTSRPSVELLPDLIKEVPILLFSGAEDLICNHLGTEAMINNLQWNDGKGFEVTPGNWAPRRDWTFEGESVGFWQEARNLTYVLFYNSSHMVPFDHPRRTRDMLDRFMEVDISSIGGVPTDSRIDGEKGPETTVGGSNKTHADEEETVKKLDAAKWAAYRKSGEIVLVIVVIATAAWGYFMWRQRRHNAVYRALSGEDQLSRGASRVDGFRRKPEPGDLEAAAFEENELDDMHVETPRVSGGEKYSVGDDSDEEQDGRKKKGSSSR